MIDDTDFTGRKVLVVGGSSGIGNGIARALRARRRGACLGYPPVGERL